MCTVCGKAVEEPVEPTDNDMWGSTGTSYEDQMAQYELDKAVNTMPKQLVIPTSLGSSLVSE